MSKPKAYRLKRLLKSQYPPLPMVAVQFRHQQDRGLNEPRPKEAATDRVFQHPPAVPQARIRDLHLRWRTLSACDNRAGQGLVEATLVLLVFFALLIGVLDCGQVLYSHQALVARVEEAVRWGAVHPFDGTGDQIANLILYSQPDEPRSATGTFLGLTRANIVVRYQPATPERPDDETISVAIVNYETHFFSPWIARTIVNARPVLVSAPTSYRSAAAK